MDLQSSQPILEVAAGPNLLWVFLVVLSAGVKLGDSTVCDLFWTSETNVLGFLVQFRCYA
jgi:hypothetical protein